MNQMGTSGRFGRGNSQSYPILLHCPPSVCSPVLPPVHLVADGRRKLSVAGCLYFAISLSFPLAAPVFLPNRPPNFIALNTFWSPARYPYLYSYPLGLSGVLIPIPAPTPALSQSGVGRVQAHDKVWPSANDDD